MQTPGVKKESLGLWGWDTFDFIVQDLERSERFYTESFGLPLLAKSTEKQIHETGEDSRLFGQHGISIACIAPKERGSRADRWLKHHPDGVAVVGLRVKDLAHTHRVLSERGATFSTPIVHTTDEAGQAYQYFEITTPLGAVRYRFVQRDLKTLPPGFQRLAPREQLLVPYQSIDHVTANMLSLEPYISWLKDILGFEEYWNVHFHTSDTQGDEGSGLASTVMWDPESKIKLANNEPAVPNFEGSQVYTFVEDNVGAGVQHIAFHVPEIQGTIDTLQRKGLSFLDVPDTYYDMLPRRLKDQNVNNFTEDIEALKKLGILVDGDDDKYLLQIFMQEAAAVYEEEKAGPFFFEIIQRKGATLFGEGNFRALFEAIERDQKARK